MKFFDKTGAVEITPVFPCLQDHVFARLYREYVHFPIHKEIGGLALRSVHART